MTIATPRRGARRALLSASTLAIILAIPALAAAQQTDTSVDEIIVTATKRDASIQDIPFSINAQTEKDIQRSGAVTLEDLSRNVAGLTIQNLGPGQSQVSVRGVSAGQVVRDQPGVKEQVGVYLDESVISLSLFTPDVDLFDLNRVETLRGPQGTLFGSGSVGGTIRYITNQPKLGVSEGLFEANANLVGGDDFGGHVKGMFNVPIGDKVAMRAVGYLTQYGGFIDARGEGGTLKKNVNDGARRGGRLSFVIKPTETVTLTPRVVYQEIRAHGFNREEVFNIFANPNTTTRPKISLGEREQYLLLPEKLRRQHPAGRLHRQFRSRRGDPDLGEQLHQPRHRREPRRQLAVGKRLGRSGLPGRGGAAAVAPGRHHRSGAIYPGTALGLDRRRALPVGVRRLLFEGRPRLQPDPADPRLRRLYRRRPGRWRLGGGGQRLPAQLALQRLPAL
jgi:outer membrane receptor protein involved in Fe transport